MNQHSLPRAGHSLRVTCLSALFTAGLASSAAAQLAAGTVLAATTSTGGNVDQIWVVPAGSAPSPVSGITSFGIGQTAIEVWQLTGFDVVMAVRRAGGIEVDLLNIVPGMGGGFVATQVSPFFTVPGTFGADPVDLLREESGTYLLLAQDPTVGPRVFRFSPVEAFQEELVITGLPLLCTSLGSGPGGTILLTEPPTGFGNQVFSVPHGGGAATATGLGTVDFLRTMTNQNGETLQTLPPALFGINALCAGAPATVVSPTTGTAVGFTTVRYNSKTVDTFLLAHDIPGAGSELLSVPADCATLTTGVVPTVLWNSPAGTDIVHVTRADSRLRAELGYAGIGSTGTALRVHNRVQADVGNVFDLDIRGALPGGALALEFGLGLTSLDLTPIGAPRNAYRVPIYIATIALVAGPTGDVTYSPGSPLTASLIGASICFQAIAFDVAANPLGLVASNAVFSVVQ